MSNYNNDQFYNWSRYETLDPTKRLATDNPSFLWPSSSRRNAIDGSSRPARRGYMRLLSEALERSGSSAALKQLGSNRLFFQFNPDTITRSVSARNDVQYWMNMDPIQLTQPIPGDQNFAFELMFNREAEVASGKVSGFSGGASTRARVGPRGELITEGLPNSQNPAIVGVLADLYKFDQIIGQGINQASIEAFVANAIALQNKAVEESKKKKQKNDDEENAENATKDDEDVEQTVEPLSDDDKRLIRENLALNVGNSAFLVANPIRIVFSSLFMVEGYVTAASVVFNKFNPSMVPTQCVVTVNMQALYIGFAKKDTFLTYNAKRVQEALEEQEEQEREEATRQNAEQSFIQGFADSGFKRRFNVEQSNIKGAYDLVDQDGGRKFSIRLDPSDDLKTAIKDGQVSKITASATWTVQYKGNTSSIPASSYAVDTTWTATQNVDFQLSDLSRAYELKFDRPSLTVGKLFDKTNTSQYTTTVKITFTYTSGNGLTVNSKQNLNWTSSTRYEPVLGKATQFGLYYTLSNG